MKTWQNLMTQGNDFYTQQQWHSALSYYQEAITLLEDEMIIDVADVQQVIQAWICGYHNVATTYEQQGLIEKSRNSLVTPFKTMLALSYNQNVSSEMKLIANFSLKITLPPLLEFANKHPNEHEFINNVVEQLNTYDQLGHSLH